jgi:ABC-2 type transport system permease protein
MPVFDQGYQHWAGELTGHSWRWWTITRHGIRIGRKSLILRLVLIIAWLPALLLAATLSIWGLVEQRSTIVQPFLPILSFFFDFLTPQVLADPKNYRAEVWTLCYSFFLRKELFFSMILILIAGPSLISQDIRFNALPLYFSRPLRRIDYFLGKLGVIATFLGLVLIVPSIIAYALGLLFSLDISILADTLPVLLASVGYGALMTLSAGLLILALSSLSRNSRYVGLFWVGVWFVTSLVGFTLESVHRYQRIFEKIQSVNAAEKADANGEQASAAEEQQHRSNAQMKAMNNIMQEEIEDAKTDWRPLASYSGNLDRIGQALLRADSCWEKLSLTMPEEQRGVFLFSNMGRRYPWEWSALVLIGLFGVSVCILNFRVKSLDRLK